VIDNLKIGKNVSVNLSLVKDYQKYIKSLLIDIEIPTPLGDRTPLTFLEEAPLYYLRKRNHTELMSEKLNLMKERKKIFKQLDDDDFKNQLKNIKKFLKIKKKTDSKYFSKLQWVGKDEDLLNQLKEELSYIAPFFHKWNESWVDGITIKINYKENFSHVKPENREIHITAKKDLDGQIKDLAHELIHLLELYYPKLREKSLKFLQERSVGQKKKGLLFGDCYGKRIPPKSEECLFFQGKFNNIYSGLVPSSEGGLPEVRSMGFQLLLSSPTTLLLQDPEYFEFLIKDILPNY
jgi:hypothetical protein